ncbi:MAG TPA: DMT family transporter [Marine Group III euryarchaeote]|jgi:drug/metabolite transporter (DMT)-like permease|uniref:DMT family transporter n=1 Tax=Marine Group III euryarchaeote TaxID=2173149 RepID=A0A7J4GSC2_9ARCH|nr:DMT family transporter [Marine Group III euryarchaeote]
MAEKNKNTSQAAIAWMVLAGLCFSATGVFVKLSGGHVIVWTVIFGRSVVIAVMTYILSKIQKVSLSFKEPKWLISRCITGFSAMACYFYAIPLIPLTTAVVLQWTSPLFVALFSGYLIKEKVSPFLFGCIGIAFAGTVLIISPSFEAIETNALYALASGILSALAYLSIRELRSTASSESVVFWFAIFCIMVSLPLSARELTTLSSYEIQILVGVGITAGIGQIGMTRAFHAAKAAYIGAFSYSTVVVSWIYGLFIFDEVLSSWDMLGTLLIVGSGIILATTSPKTTNVQAP